MTKDIAGLNEKQIADSKQKHGTNVLKKEKSKGFFKRFIENLNDPIIKILVIALIVEVVFTFSSCNLFEVFGIVIAILLATTVSTASEFGSERAFMKMQEETAGAKVRVYRNGSLCEISSDDLVVGDVMLVSRGEKIYADGRVIDGEIKVDQSALNGESKDVTKKVCPASADADLSDKGAVFRGSIVLGGDALVRVVRVGTDTYYGMVARDVQSETRKSPLKVRLGVLAGQISRIGYVMAGVVCLAYLWTAIVSSNGYIWRDVLSDLKDFRFMFTTLTHALTLMITVIVVAAPEGLPMMITVVLSANMRRMMKDGVLVKKLVGIETAGSMNILFTDKTGTLTYGKLECDKIITADNIYSSATSLKGDKELYALLLKNARLNTCAVRSDKGYVGGNSTERAIAEYFRDDTDKWLVAVDKIPFSTESKMSWARLSDGYEFMKGAPELIIEKCDRAYKRDAIDRRALTGEYIKQAKEGNRVIAVAFRKSAAEPYTFLCLLVLRDKIRRGVRTAVEGVRRAGVQVVMLTGDGKETARAIASECGILTDADDIVMTSDELKNIDDEKLKEILPRLRVLARALPQDKTRLVRISQELDLVCAMTGDGINDAPALKLADVGFAMGNGEDIAKNAADIELANNSFLSINRTILYGRTIFKSIRKFITFQLIMNIAACGVSLFGQFLGIESPITIIQMLWVNIIMDTLGGLAFAGEPPLEYYMKEKPKRRDEPILNSEMLSHIFFCGAYTLILCICFLKLEFFSSAFRPSEENICFMTGFYALFIFAGIFNCFGARCERLNIFSNITKNKPFVFIMILISCIQIFMIYYGGTLFRTVPLLPSELRSVLLLSFTVLPFEMCRRTIFKMRK